MAEELGERTEDPTTRKRTDARSRGQVAKSQDLSSAIDLIGGAALVALFGGAIVAALGTLMRQVLAGQVPGDPLEVQSAWTGIGWAAAAGARIIAPILAAMFLVALLGQVLQVGWLLSSQPLRPKLERLNPAAGIKRLFSKRNAVKSAVNTVKLVLMIAVAAVVLQRLLPRIAALPMLTLVAAMYRIVVMGLELLAWLLPLLLAIGLIDWVYQRWQHTQDLKMTRQEVKDERKSVEGDPDIKARRMRMARDIALQKLGQAVPRADVVVTNPTHFAVALEYDPERMRAPRVIAKGGDYMAMRIRHLALSHGIPIVERPPLARALFHGVDVGREVSAEHYEAVAEVLAYVYRMQGRAA